MVHTELGDNGMHRKKVVHIKSIWTFGNTGCSIFTNVYKCHKGKWNPLLDARCLCHKYFFHANESCRANIWKTKRAVLHSASTMPHSKLAFP